MSRELAIMNRVLVTGGAGSLGGQPITIYGDGMQTRSFCYVEASR
jgi:nucleoside-diphosphate-sugar epimerase